MYIGGQFALCPAIKTEGQKFYWQYIVVHTTLNSNGII